MQFFADSRLKLEGSILRFMDMPHLNLWFWRSRVSIRRRVR